jgi:hypothetical protein
VRCALTVAKADGTTVVDGWAVLLLPR